jgi:tripartite-type tricarboxylate transporter receptor subunit TctC
MGRKTSDHAGRPAVTRRLTLVAPALLLAARAGAETRGEEWRPGQQVRIVAGAAASGTTDIMARMVAQHLQQKWGTPVVVENRTGAGGTIATAEIVRTKPDGLNLLSGNIGPQAIAYSLYRNLSYRPEQITNIAGTITGPNVLVVNANTPVRNMAEFAAWLRAEKGRVTFASTGTGQSTHLSPVWMLQLLNIEAVHVPYRGSAPAQTAMLAGECGFLIDNLTGVIEQVRSGRLRALAVTSAERSPALPDVPAMRETLPELASYEVNTWFGIFGPAGMPEAMVNGLNHEINAWLDLAETKRRFAELGGGPLRLNPDDFTRFVQAEIVKWRGVIQKEGLQIDAT